MKKYILNNVGKTILECPQCNNQVLSKLTVAIVIDETATHYTQPVTAFMCEDCCTMLAVRTCDISHEVEADE